ncbi:Delta-aminolevulinic acid dehydratase [Nitrospina gracilis 3/211]|uniref:Delta-aminolevulinic acid dehydratase n=1 Tax=Nitrospina gracilis (strain 3/211) TaxID=1266370 RepID=M1YMW0_NITG3|nr:MULTISPECIES: porphobilinogen synthase [Nitrospina]MCF8724635.1 porphobilinogen synthase [Nitrospina sp. Nb-3]CCQ91816.1 Delta-aminolevulinic acid dehydratase [Nitrospina gracilis 3/211]
MPFPIHRPRRLRKSAAIQRMVRETVLTPDDLILPLFVCEGKNVRTPIGSMPGIDRLSIDLLGQEVKEAHSLGIPAVILFGIPDHKDAQGTEAYNPDGVVQRAIREIKSKVPEMVVVTDVCIDEYTDHGHCGLVEGDEVVNDPTLELLARMSLTHADCGADIVAPSDMMDGRVQAIRKALDENSHQSTLIMSYAAKYASAFYGPFREAADSAPQFGDRRSYQMDPGNSDEALREVEQDIEEGADILMVKPALPYLDIIRRVRDTFPVPLAAYNVSGEYSMLMAAAEKGWVDGDRVMLEVLLSIKRAGAQMILTYSAMPAARLLNG